MAFDEHKRFRSGFARILSAAVALAGPAGVARAVDLTAYVQEGYSFSEGTTTSGSVASHLESQAFVQKYQLGVRQAVYPSLRLDATGFLNWAKGWTDTDGVWAKTDSKLWDASARLAFGSTPISGQIYFDLAQNINQSTTAGLTYHAPTISRESLGFNGRWLADGFPTIGLTLQRTNVWDTPRQSRDDTTDSVFLSTQYLPVRGLDLHYTLRYDRASDHLSLLVVDGLGHAGGVSYGDRLAGGRIVYAVSYNVGYNTQTVHVPSGSTTVTLQRFPLTGLSLVEAIADTPLLDKTNPNPALVDGNLTAGAGIDIGYSPSSAGDTSYRDIGASFADPLTVVDQIYVYVDRRLPAEIVAAHHWTAYASDDNQTWTEVGVSGVTFGAIDNRIEIRTSPARARYFKVVTKPLPLGTTTDRTYANVYVTEIQLYDAVAAGSLPPTTNALAGTAAASARVVLVPALNLVYDVSGSVFHQSVTRGVDQLSWNVSNGVAAGGQVSPILTLTGRAEDFVGSTQLSTGTATISEFRLTASAAARFLPTLGTTFTYQLQHAFAASALARTYQALMLSASADFYSGVSLSAQGSYTFGTQGFGQDFANAAASAYLTVVPNSTLTLTVGTSYAEVQTRNEGQPWTYNRSGLVQASIAYTPIQALSLNASVSRYPWYAVPTTTFSGSANFLPFPGGKLLLGFQYNQYLDTATSTNTLQFGPSIRWTLRPGTFVDVFYTRQRVRFTGYESLSNVVFTNLTIAL
jgi:hypothetical protein